MNKADKVPPHSQDAEKSTLGSMLLDDEAIYKANEILDSNCFYWESHKLTFEVITELNNNNKPADLVTVNQALRDKGQLEEVGGASYITSLANAVPTAANVEYYANIVKEKAEFRNLIKTGGKIKQLGYNSEESEKAIYKAEELIYNLTNENHSGQNYDIKDIILELSDKIEKRAKGEIDAIPTKYPDFNNLLSAGGIEKQTLTVIAARSSMGKTSFALNLAEHWGVEKQIPLAIFSLETGRGMFAQRLLAINKGIPLRKFKRPDKLTEQEQDKFWQAYSIAAGEIGESPITINDKAGLSVGEIKSHIINLKRQEDIKIAIIDYLQLINPDYREDTRTQELGKITNSLKNLARDLDISIILISQLNRGVENRQNKRPMMSDIRGSGKIEEDSDLIISLYRDDYYNPDTEKEGITEVSILKQKEGATETFELGFRKPTTQFLSLTKREE